MVEFVSVNVTPGDNLLQDQAGQGQIRIGNERTGEIRKARPGQLNEDFVRFKQIAVCLTCVSTDIPPQFLSSAIRIFQTFFC